MKPFHQPILSLEILSNVLLFDFVCFNDFDCYTTYMWDEDIICYGLYLISYGGLLH